MPARRKLRSRQQKSTGLDDIHRHPQAGAQPHQAARILRNVGLIQRQAHPIRPLWPQVSTGRKRHFLRHRAARPSKFDSLFYRAEQTSAAGMGAGASPRHSVPALECGNSFSIQFSKGDPVTATTHDAGTRRDFLYVASGAMGAVGAAAAAWPFIDQMNPSAAALALASTEVDHHRHPARPAGHRQMARPSACSCAAARRRKSPPPRRWM